MGVRKNAKFLTALEREDFVKACVLMKADIVNPGAPASEQYSKWDESVALHLMIQQGLAGGLSVNFGHGGSGAYSFYSWHRYYLYQFEQQLQSYVPGVMVPYWDWTDPSSIMTDTFLGPDGGTGTVVQTGYFAESAPGTGSNTTASPAWWPAGLSGWTLHSSFGSFWDGGLKRSIGSVSGLPSASAVSAALALTTYSAFQNAVESGSGLPSGHNQMHNGMHIWIGGHMGDPTASPFDPFFYLHHCNIDRLWAMWQVDGHDTVYPSSGGDNQHHRTDLMYPWVGTTAGYGTSSSISSSIPMPDYSALGPQSNEDTLDYRNAFGYTYDCISVIGIGLDRTGSMNGLTPDPMVVTNPDVTKWEAAKRGVSAFLQDCETVQDSGTIYVTGGVKTFRSSGGNQFDNVFTSPGYGLIKQGTSFSKASFDSSIAAMSPGGGTPLADALLDVENTLVDPVFGGIPADERRYLAMLTDGILTSGAAMSTISAGSLDRTVIFGMGFGNGAAVDYATIADMVSKGQSIPTTQVFHGENAGTIDKFYSNALAAAIGFTSVFDPVLELFEGEHAHLNYYATSADDALLITCQGMDFSSKNWSYVLKSPSGDILYGDHQHNGHESCNHCCPLPIVTNRVSNGRLTLVVQRDHASKHCWVGKWQLMIAYKTRDMDKMMMPVIGELIFPVSAGLIRGNQYNRLLTKTKQRQASRNMIAISRNSLDTRAVGTNSNDREACNVVVNIYARTNLKLDIGSKTSILKTGCALDVNLVASSNLGMVEIESTFARLISPSFDINKIISQDEILKLKHKAEKYKRYSNKYDPAIEIARRLRDQENKSLIVDKEVIFKRQKGQTWTLDAGKVETPGVQHIGIMVTGVYHPQYKDLTADHCCDDKHNHAESFTRILNYSIAVK